MTYSEARTIAQAAADATGFDHGVELLGDRYSVRMLPGRPYRFGSELRCEVFHCCDLAKCRKNHGPV